MSAYRAAIDQTTKTIDTRTQWFRNLIIAFVAVTLGSIGWTVLAWTFAPLAGLLLLLPLSGLFFVLDSETLNDWRSHLIAAWIKKDIDFRGFHEAIGSVPKLPKDTLGAMLQTLPRARYLVEEQGISASTRGGVAAAVWAIHRCQSDALALRAAAAAIVSGSVIIAVARRGWKPLLGCLAVLLLPILRRWLLQRRIGVLKERTLAARAKPAFSSAKYGELVACLQWDAIPASERDGVLGIQQKS